MEWANKLSKSSTSRSFSPLMLSRTQTPWKVSICRIIRLTHLRALTHTFLICKDPHPPHLALHTLLANPHLCSSLEADLEHVPIKFLDDSFDSNCAQRARKKLTLVHQLISESPRVIRTNSDWWKLDSISYKMLSIRVIHIYSNKRPDTISFIFVVSGYTRLDDYSRWAFILKSYCNYLQFSLISTF